MEDQVPFKVFAFWSNGSKPEVWRFSVEKSVVTSFHYLIAKLQDVYPGLKEKNYYVTWKDEDGDDNTISSDEEMITALRALHGNLIKLNVYIKNEAPKVFGPSNSSHYGIFCDGCDWQVVGFRYKCTSCDDFDLCSKCESSGLHPEHCMVRVPSPVMPRHLIKAAFKRSRHLKTVASAGADVFGPSNSSHYGIFCDGCDWQVVGFRYQCTSCDDFDLCSKCESSGLHPEHCMVRVPSPVMPFRSRSAGATGPPTSGDGPCSTQPARAASSHPSRSQRARPSPSLSPPWNSSNTRTPFLDSSLPLTMDFLSIQASSQPCLAGQQPAEGNSTKTECTICFDNPIDCALYACGHMCMCYTCAVQQWRGNGNGKCPQCRAEIKDVIRIYKP